MRGRGIYVRQRLDGGRYPHEGATRAGSQSVPQCDEISDDDNYHLGIIALPHRGAGHPIPAHPGMARGGNKQLSRHDWYETLARPVPTPPPPPG